MIVAAQFDLTNPEDAAKFNTLIGSPATGAAKTEAPAEDPPKKPRSRKRVTKAEREAAEKERQQEAKAAGETLTENIMPTIEDVAKLFNAAQEVNAEAAGKCMKAFLDKCNCKSARDLNDQQRFDLKKELDAIAYNPFS